MAKTQYLALLRGINVGGNNIIKMADLKVCFESHGLTNVATYIQSGNVLFEADVKDTTALTNEVERLLSKTFGYDSKIVLRSHAEMKTIVTGAPKGFGSEPAKYRDYVLFLKEPLTTAEAMRVIPLKEGVDQAWSGPKNVVFHQRLETRATQSHLNRLVAMPIYKNMTIRNWNTTSKLLVMMDARAEAS